MSTAAATKTKKIFDGRYEIGSVVGRGAKSVVYEARLVSNPSEQVALKVLLAGDSQNATTERLRREALALVSCRHKYVVRLDDFHSAGPLSYLALEFAPLGDLRRYTLQNELSLETIERFLKQSLEALGYIHRAGIIHRDIKPENILVASDKEIRITDFGVALLPGEEASLADLQSGVGTMNYMAPEIIEGKHLDARADLYALGVIFYELLAGKNPFEDAPLAQQLELRKLQSFADLSDVSKYQVPTYLQEVILRAMAYEPSDRFGTADEMLQALIDGHSAEFEKSKADLKKSKKPARVAKVKRPKTVPLSKRYKYKEAEKEAERLFKELFGEDADWLKDSAAGETKAVAAEEEAGHSEESGATTNNSSTLENPADLHNTSNEEAVNHEPATKSEHMAEETIQLSGSAESSKASDLQNASETALQAGSDKAANTLDFSSPVTGDEQKTPSPKNIRQIFSSFALPALIFLAILLGGAYLINKGLLLISNLTGINISMFAEKEEQSFLPQQRSRLEGSTFPNLPAGIFGGAIQGLLGNGEIPISIISSPKAKQLGLIIQLEGYRPIWVSTEGISENSAVRFSSSGLVLELTGQNVDGKIAGTYKNFVSGREGKWFIQ